MPRKTTRRDFVKQSAALGTAFWVSGRTAYTQDASPMERLSVACVGVEGKGSSDTDNAARFGCEVIGLCDIDDQRLKKKGLRYRDAKQFHDYREMISELGAKIDVVTVSTPDHSHAPAAALAMKHGKHVYCQKPLTWSVQEARRLRELAAETGVVTQMGNQGTSENGLREAVEVVRAGAIGDVTEVHVWTNRPIWPQGEGRPKETPPVPEHIKWDLFLGPAPERPYHPAYLPFKWRGWLDFGTGALGDMACHTANMAVMALSLFDPVSVIAESSGIVENETYPKNSKITFEFPERDGLPACTMIWYDGGNLPPTDLLQGKKMSSSGSLLVGSKGSLYSPNDYGAAYFLLPEDQYEGYKKPPQSLPRVETPGGTDQRHMSEFIAACRGEGKPMSNFDYAGRLTETILLGNFALHSTEKLMWDAKEMKVTNIPEMNQYVGREYREGWTL